MCRQMAQTDSAYTETVHGAVAAHAATCQCTYVNENQLMGCQTVLLFCAVHINKGVTLKLLQCLRVICGCRTVQTNSTETPQALLHMLLLSQYNQLRLAPSIP